MGKLSRGAGVRCRYQRFSWYCRHVCPAAAAGLPGGDRERAQRCWVALAERVDASGYPIGVAPNNKAQGGEDLQRQPGRSSTPFGLGLVAQLAAQLELTD